MKKEKEVTLKKAYSDYVNLILNDFSIERLDEIVAENLKGFGSTVDEKFLDISRFRRMIQDQRKQEAGLDIKWTQKSVDRRISPEEDSAIYTDEFTLTMQIEGDKHVIPLRLSSIFEYTNSTWKVVHIHGSVGVETEENDTWHKEEWKQKQEELERQVQEKTAELVYKNRELEIEAALERVRARSMSMHNAQEMEQCAAVVFQQLEVLGIEAFRCGFAIAQTQNDDVFDLWSVTTSDEEKKVGVVGQINSMGHPVVRAIRSAWQANKSVFSYDLSGKEMVDYYKYITKDFHLPEADTPVEALPKRLVYYHATFKHGTLYGAFFKPLPDGQIDILVRFAKVFEQTYTRFLDLQKAETQAREAQIEAALEKVRSRSLAMHKSEQLPETAKVLFEQFELLGEVPDRIGICIINEEIKEFDIWLTDQIGSQLNHRFKGAFEEATVWAKMYKAWKDGKDSNVIDLSGQDLKDWVKYVRENLELPVDDTQIKERRVHQAAFFSQGMILFTSNDPVGDETIRLLVRFTKVFDQAYIRFLDLQKAEAQAREAQIEAALERVRASTMAMHKSEELFNTVNILYLEIAKLGFTNESTDVEICIIDESDRILETWSSDQNFSGSEIKSSYVRLNEVPVLSKQFTDWFKTETSKRKTLSLDFEAQGKEWKGFVKYMAKHPDWAEAIKVFRANKINRWFWHHAYHRYGSITIQGIAPVSQGIHEIMRRFSNVFEQTYTRFLDLKKAEAQAREAQIEVALERVRARSMAMHKSDELAETAAVLFQQLNELGVNPERANIGIVREEERIIEWWSTEQGGKQINNLFKGSIDEPTTLSKVYSGWKRGEKSMVIEQSGKQLKAWIQYMTEELGLPFKEKLRQDRRYQSIAFYTHGMILLTTPEPLPEEMLSLLPRFAKVFEQTYTRFLDLQKAETQAREAQVEVALERVRAASMAMHRSEELPNVALTLLNEIEHLSIPLIGAGIALTDTVEETQILYLAVSDGKDEKRVLLTTERHPIKEIWVSEKALKMIHKGEKEMLFVAEGNKLEQWIKWVEKYQSTARANQFREAKLKKVYINLIVFYDYSILAITSLLPFTEEHWSIVRRLSKTFGMSYTRFLDLQKAEAQAREAQIEAALERVRAKAMAMHNTKDISDATAIVFNELTRLGVEMVRCGIGILHDKSSQLEIWSTPMSPKDKKVKEVIMGYVESNFHPMIQSIFEAWRNNESYFTYTLHANEVREYYERLSKVPGYRFPKIAKYSDRQMLHCFYFEHGNIFVYSEDDLSEEQKLLLHRFTKVFSLTYKRYLDLKNAEAQVREAHIEAALERVRSRSMAMHKSDELQEVINRLFLEIESLGVKMGSSYLVTELDEDITKGVHIWIQNNVNLYAERVHLPYLDHPMFHKFYKAWQDKTPFYTETFNKKEKNRLFNHLFKHSKQLSAIPDERKKFVLDGSGFSRSVVFYKNVAFVIQKYEKLPFNPEEISIQKRFGNVFEQTYTRFLDLKSAEAQAREAQIEAALERVRSKTMAMHNSHDVGVTVAALFEEVLKLGLDKSIRCGIGILKGNERMETWSATLSRNGEVDLKMGMLDMKIHPLLKRIKKAWECGETHYADQMTGKSVVRYYTALNNEPDYSFHINLDTLPKKEFHNSFSFSEGILFSFSPNPMSEEAAKVLNRFARVFEQTYTRFLDLQKAEAQAREAQIETGLERVRARAMAMHNSKDLPVTASVVFNELGKLGISTMRSGISIQNRENRKILLYTGTNLKDGNKLSLVGSAVLDNHPILKEIYDRWIRGEDYFPVLKGDLLKSYYEQIAPNFTVPKEQTEVEQYGYFISYSNGIFYGWAKQPFTDEEKKILNRFASVVDLTFKRYFDLKRAEQNAREAQIEASLERIRAKAMSMHNSKDISDATGIVFSELENLGIETLRCGIGIMSDKHQMSIWTAISEQKADVARIIGSLNMKGHKAMAEAYRSWQNQDAMYSYKLKGKALESYYSALSNDPNYPIPEMNAMPEKHTLSTFNFKEGLLFTQTKKGLSEGSTKILSRFTNVFALTYRRYLDLVQAEAQAREAQIEAALERIRAKALTMQTSADLHDVSMVLREQMGILGQPDLESSIVHLYNNSKSLESWYTFRSTETNSLKIVTDVAFIPINSCDYIKETIEKYNSNESEYTIVSKGKKLADWYNVMVKVAPDTIEYDKKGKILIPEILYYHHSKFSGGALLMISNQPPSTESKELQRRAARVFNFAYQRFLDLKNAESQAREAQIEAALERVRSKAMAMQQSEDLSQSMATTLDELEKLELQIQRCGVGIFSKEKLTVQLWTTTLTDEGKQAFVLGELPLMKHPMMKGSYDSWLKKKGYSHILEGDDLKAYYAMLKEEGFALPADNNRKAKSTERQYYNYFTFPAGGLYVFSEETLSKEEGNIVQRFADVFHLAFTRYLDLQNAEARAVEAVKQASLDRVRAEIASMRTANDLQQITPLIWSELTILGVPFIRCGVFIMDDVNALIKSYLSTPDGKSLGVYDLPYSSTEIAKKLVQRWKNKKAYKEHWDKVQFLKFMGTMAKRGLIQDQQTYQGDAKPPESLDLYFVPFKQGMLYVGNSSPLDEDELQLVKSLADAFSIAYVRYEDFTQLEAANNQMELTLNELKSTQSQLIQSEKMASLGELTAGIAHEIQNPLNFVNNFSEVSKELIEEMNEEMEIGNLEEVKEITGDIMQNLDKIHHHGQRASSIVKGMLEHSRTGDRKKELTDLNVLADEYLRLAFHGLRAKDKTFNADFNTELDESLPKVQVISQDISRVLLNLINNAFYTVSKKSKEAIEGYTPTVTVRTKRNDKTIELSVQDNGHGIPKDALDKIFQPFFTTKPTGEGTGLGLSLSYDIITQGHDGHLEVETEEGMGTRFIVQLPILNK